MTQEFIVVKSIEILATPDRVWSALTESDKIAQWMGDTHIETKWEMGGDIIFTGTMPNFNRKYRDRGTILVVEQGKLLRYNRWSEITRLPDTPQNRTLITFILDEMEEKTRLTVRHENFHSEVEYKHANFFWPVALHMLKNLLEA
jgi:uncharacterized protein YndB with AHSA1/START domain